MIVVANQWKEMDMKKIMTLAEWAGIMNVPYNTAWKWHKGGRLPVISYKSADGKNILVEDEVDEANNSNNALSLFLTKTVEHIKNNSSIEEFAAFIIANFKLELNIAIPDIKSTLDLKTIKARVKTQEEQSDDARAHFQQESPFSQEKEAQLREARIKLKAGLIAGDMVPASAFNDSLLIEPLLAELALEKDNEESK